jgi:hypothetical protein
MRVILSPLAFLTPSLHFFSDTLFEFKGEDANNGAL